LNQAGTPEIEVNENPNFRTINVGGVYGSPMGMRFEVIVYSEHLDATKALASAQQNTNAKVSRTLECRLVIDPLQAKAIAQWLTAHVNAFESQYGHIPSAEDWERNATSNEPLLGTSTDMGATFGPIMKLSANGTIGSSAGGAGG
jgi:hypothetical protein